MAYKGTASAHALYVGGGSSTPSLYSTSAASYFTSISFDTGSHALNAYSKGTWTPTLTGTSSTQTYTAQVGLYNRIGNIVSASSVIVLASVSAAGTGNLVMGSLPFTSQNTSNYLASGFTFVQNFSYASSGSYIVATVAANSTTGTFGAVKASSATTTISAGTQAATTEFDTTIQYLL